MNDLLELYQELILDHNRRPRNQGELDRPDRTADGYNPLCGDRIRVEVRLAGDVIDDIRCAGSGCAISTASWSLMSEAVKGKTVHEARTLFDDFRRLVTGEQGKGDSPALGKLEALAGVRRFPGRVKCATLAWHTLNAALDQHDGTVTTE